MGAMCGVGPRAGTICDMDPGPAGTSAVCGTGPGRAGACSVGPGAAGEDAVCSRGLGLWVYSETQGHHWGSLTPAVLKHWHIP